MPPPNLRDTAAPTKAPFVVEAPPEEEFWERYNRRLEFPLAAVGAVLIHVVVLVGLVYGLLSLMAGEKNPGPKVELMQVGGLDDDGDGSAGSGGQPNPDLIRDVSPDRVAKETLPTPQSLADAKENIQKIVLDDPNGKIPISAANAAAYSQLDDNLKKKLLGIGSQKGEGNQPGKGTSGEVGGGPGGTGANSTKQRGLRWVLRFNVASGRNYLEQLKAMNAKLLVPIPNGPDSIYIADIGNPGGQRKATDADLRELSGYIQFSDTRRDAVHGVAGALGLDFTPKTFFAFFPKNMEDELARKETAFRNRRAEDIEETIFRVTITGGSYAVVVDEQIAKK